MTDTFACWNSNSLEKIIVVAKLDAKKANWSFVHVRDRPNQITHRLRH